MEAPTVDELGRIVPGTIRYDLTRVSPSDDDSLSGWKPVPDAETRFRASPAGSKFIADEFFWDGEDLFSWDDCWRMIPADVMGQVFSFEEMFRMQFFCVIRSNLSEWIEKSHFLIWKVQNSLWHYGAEVLHNRVCDLVRQMSRLSFPGMDARLVHTSAYNEFGPCVQDRSFYLDGVFGLAVLHHGKHVLTIGFSPGDLGIYVSQVQLRSKKGNRFLYKLAGHYLDCSLEALFAAFGDQLWLVRGQAAVDAVRRSYGKIPCSMSPEDEGRIRDLYDRPLARFDRTRDSVVRQGREYVRLLRKSEPGDA